MMCIPRVTRPLRQQSRIALSLRQIIATGIVQALSVALMAAAREPSIERIGAEYRAVIPEAMQKAISRRAPGFLPWRQNEYIPSLLKNYKFSEIQAPFAVVGDFNGDGARDVVLAGHTKEASLLIAVLSGLGDFSIEEIQRGPLIDLKEPWYDVGGGRKEHGLGYYLRYVPRQRISSPHEPRPLTLRTDAFESVAFERAAAVFYFENGKFRRYVTAD